MRLPWDPRISIVDSLAVDTEERASFFFHEIGSLVDNFFKGLIELLQCRVSLLIRSIHEVSYVSNLPYHALS